MPPEDDETGRFSVLVVCRANICRSPTAQLMLSRCLVANGIADLVDVASAGVLADPGQPWCEVAAGKVSDGDDRTQLRAQHTSRRLDKAMVDAADLVLTAARAERAAVVHLSPTATVRTFTLKEAAILAGAVADSLTSGRAAGSSRPSEGAFAAAPPPPASPPTDRLRWLVSEMHNARGLVRMPEDAEQRVGLLRRRHVRGTDGIDIADPHGGERARHSPSQLLDAVRAWADAAAIAVGAGEAQD
jgi:low molecular weight protein-tyrosine phosphatase